MKKKILIIFTVVLTIVDAYSQPNTEDYVSGLIDPSGILAIGTDLYVHGSENLYKIDTTNPSPVANTIYTPESDFFITDVVIDGTTLYMAQENYIIATETWLGSRIVSLDLNNPTAPVQVIFSNAMEYISGLTIDGNTIYFSSETLVNFPDFEPFFTHIDKIDITQTNPVPVNLVPNINEDNVVRDIIFDNNKLLISIDNGKIYGVDTTVSNPTVETTVDGLNFNKGIFKKDNELYVADGFQVRKIELNNPSASLVAVAQNVTYEDTNNGTPFFANFRDIVLIANRMYMSLQNQGRIVSAIDDTLSTDNFIAFEFSLYPNPAKDQFTIQLASNTELENVKIYNSLGQLVSTSKEIIIVTAKLAAGLYIVEIETNKGKASKKLIIK